MRSGSKRYRVMLHELQQYGVTASILRIQDKHYEVHVDFEIKQQYRHRRSANRYLVRLHKKTTGGDRRHSKGSIPFPDADKTKGGFND